MDERIELATKILEDPLAFGSTALRHRYWSKQRELLRALKTHRWIAVKGCNGSGKAYSAADGVFWWINHFRDGISIITSPSDTQLRRVMWGYLHRNLKAFRVPSWSVNQLEIKISENNYALGFTTNEAERMSGWHGKVLIVIDEAPGVPAYIWEAIEGIAAAGDVCVLALGNPTIPGGPFYNAFTSGAKRWKTISIDAFDTPNLKGVTVRDLVRMSDAELAHNPWPELTKRQWVLDMWNEHGDGNLDKPNGDPIWQSRVRGMFPEQSPFSLYPLKLLEQAQMWAPDPGGPVVAGIDVAGPGKDETALTIRCRDVILKELAWPDADAIGPVVAALNEFAHRLVMIHVDADGMGWYFYTQLCAEFGEHRVTPIRGGDPSINPERWANFKAQAYWALRERLVLAGVQNWQDREAFSQATAARYEQDAKGRIAIEHKDKVRKRTGKSPDRLESKIYAFLNPPEVLPSGGVKVGGQRGMQRGPAW